LQKHWSHRGFLVALDHQQWGQAAVWLSEPLEDFDVQQWQKAQAHLPSWQRPKAFVQCKLPLTASGKWDRRKGRSMAQELALL
jgi:acyl-CoA synthetase (AMP-forming)/AMP-acid ligase II